MSPVTSAETQVLGSDEVADASNHAKAILNILDDFREERARQGDNQRAVLNILEDMDAEKIRLEATQKAILNILDDFDVERQRVESANADLQEVNEAMRAFTAVAAHDLRSPLASIVGFSTILTKSWATLSEDDRRKFVAAIDRQSQNLSRLIDDLLTLSNLESGVPNTRPEMVGLGEAINRCLEAGGGDTASVSVSCSPELVVRIDPHHLGRILDNYVQNALKYGEPPVRIEAHHVGDAVEIRVLDHGPGVPSAFVPRLFGKFTRADTASTRAEKGSGLGLSIVRGLAEANGGQTRYEPNLPRGACFIVRLNAADVPGEADVPAGVTALVVVEDDPDVKFLIRTVFSLDTRFFLAGEAGSAEEGLELVRSIGPGLIVLDHGLAGELTGIKAAPLFKRVTKGAKIILFSAHAELQAQAEAEPAIDAFLLKTDVAQLLRLAQQLTVLGPPPG